MQRRIRRGYLHLGGARSREGALESNRRQGGKAENTTLIKIELKIGLNRGRKTSFWGACKPGSAPAGSRGAYPQSAKKLLGTLLIQAVAQTSLMAHACTEQVTPGFAYGDLCKRAMVCFDFDRRLNAARCQSQGRRGRFACRRTHEPWLSQEAFASVRLTDVWTTVPSKMKGDVLCCILFAIPSRLYLSLDRSPNKAPRACLQSSQGLRDTDSAASQQGSLASTQVNHLEPRT